MQGLSVTRRIFVAAVLLATGCERKPSPPPEWQPSELECQNLVGNLGHFGHPDYVVRYFGPSTPDAGLLDAPQVAQRLLYSAVVHRCVNPLESDQWLRTAICLTPANSDLIGEAREQIRQIRSELDGGATTTALGK